MLHIFELLETRRLLSTSVPSILVCDLSGELPDAIIDEVWDDVAGEEGQGGAVDDVFLDWEGWEDEVLGFDDGWAEWEDEVLGFDDGWAEWEDEVLGFDDGWAEWEDEIMGFDDSWTEWDDESICFGEGWGDWEYELAFFDDGSWADGDDQIIGFDDGWADGDQEMISFDDGSWADWNRSELDYLLSETPGEVFACGGDVDLERWYTEDDLIAMTGEAVDKEVAEGDADNADELAVFELQQLIDPSAAGADAFGTILTSQDNLLGQTDESVLA